jgi:predicted TIM-barrel fold metal-dependent hydrolase
MRQDPQELKLMAIESMLALTLNYPPSKEEIEDMKKEMELAKVNPKFFEFRPPKTKEQKTVVEYMEYHHKVKDVERKISKEEFEILKEKLLNLKTKPEEIKKALVILAHQGTKEAIKLLEEYQRKAPKPFNDWAKLALEECKIFSKTPPGKVIRIIHE